MKIWKGFSLMGILIVVMLGGMILGINRASFQRSLKSFVSNWSGGLHRTVTVYDYNGKPLKSWTGTFDVSSSQFETWFDLDGKRVIIHGGIVINEEN